MKKNNWILALILALPLLLTACHDDDDDLIGLWTSMSDLTGIPRGNASSFTIGNVGYVVGGMDGTNRLRDMWKYEMNSNMWIKCDSFPGTARQDAVAFAVNGKGYYGTGYNNKATSDENPNGYYNDFWEYDPTTDSWREIEPFPGTKRYGALAFSANSKGYVGFGYDTEQGYLKDFYSYDPLTGKWTDIGTISQKRVGASVFVINDIAYIVGGQNSSGFPSEFVCYDAKNDEWTKLRDIADTTDEDYDDDYTTIVRNYACTFVIDGKGYLATGTTSGVNYYTWEYDPVTDLWENVAKFKGTARYSAVSFSTGVKEGAFIVAGRSSNQYFDDLWTFDPYVYDDDDY